MAKKHVVTNYQTMLEVKNVNLGLQDLIQNVIYARGCVMRDADWERATLLISFLKSWIDKKGEDMPIEPVEATKADVEVNDSADPDVIDESEKTSK